MAHLEKLPWELIEEILSRVPPKSLVRFRTVSKRWNALFDDKAFMNNHKMTFRFILATESKIYSVSIDPVIVVRELNLGTPGLKYLKLGNLVDSNELLLCGKQRGAVAWNPWLGQSRWIKPSLIKGSYMEFVGIVYNNKKYMMVAFSYGKEDGHFDLWKIYDFASDVLIDYKSQPGNSSSPNAVSSESDVSLNGTLYCVCFREEIDPLCYHICKFDFSSEKWKKNCNLPCGRHHVGDALVLGAFKEDRFSLLNQCIVTKKIEIWVTENKINYENGGDVVWMNFMTLSSPNLPGLVDNVHYSQPSYFIEGKRLVVCFVLRYTWQRLYAAERLNNSGHSENDVLKVAHNIYFSDYKTKFTMEHYWCLLRFEQKWLNLHAINNPSTSVRTKMKPVAAASQSETASKSEATHTEKDFEKRPQGVKAAKASRNNGQGKALAEYKRMWEVKKLDMAEKEKLQKLGILDTLLAKPEPLSAVDQVIKDKIVAQYFCD
ncbi:PREDICTED: F-box protein At2g14710-like [Camelina sativa]|uniref:F-box protein At2g14710-like n=1 Tax=Camelina sativa TaxID=90675 RepID=A0ABM1QNP3_CAMSA|nr:PREDICTED: F-box protein At2g14710-like [Camelina sativa]